MNTYDDIRVGFQSRFHYRPAVFPLRDETCEQLSNVVSGSNTQCEQVQILSGPNHAQNKAVSHDTNTLVILSLACV